MGEEVVKTEQGKGSAKSTGTSTAGAGAGTRTGARTGAGTKEKQTEKLPELSPVEQGEPLKVEIAPVEEKPKPKRTTTRKKKTVKKKEEVPDTAQLNLLLATISGLIAARPGCEHWMLTEKEIESITVPLSKVIAENESLKAISEHTNGVALIMACITVFVPRLVISAGQMKEKKKKSEVLNNVGSEPVKKAEVEKPDSGTVKRSPATDRNHDSALSLIGHVVG